MCYVTILLWEMKGREKKGRKEGREGREKKEGEARGEWREGQGKTARGRSRLLLSTLNRCVDSNCRVVKFALRDSLLPCVDPRDAGLTILRRARSEERRVG